MKFLSCRSLVLALLLIGALAGPTSVGAQLSDAVGVNIHAPQYPVLPEVLDAVEAAHVGWVRIDFVWAWVQPERNVWDWSRYDTLVEEARVRGLEILAIAAYTPAWATDGAPISGVPRDVEDWRRFCRAAARRYRGRIAAWEVWNEPNLPQFWSGSRREYLDRILAPGADALRDGSPEALIGGPGLAHLVSGDRDWYAWLAEALDHSGHRLGFISHHVYDTDGHRDVTSWLERDTLFGDRERLWPLLPPSVRELLDSRGYLGYPFWLTETGFRTQLGPNAVPSEEWQANQLDGLLSDWLEGDPERNWIEKIFVYEIQDDPTPGVPRFGLLRPDGSPKAGYHAVGGVAGRLAVRAPPPGAGDPRRRAVTHLDNLR